MIFNSVLRDTVYDEEAKTIMISGYLCNNEKFRRADNLSESIDHSHQKETKGTG